MRFWYNKHTHIYTRLRLHLNNTFNAEPAHNNELNNEIEHQQKQNEKEECIAL